MNALSWTAVGFAGATAIFVSATVIALAKQSRYFGLVCLISVACVLATIGVTVAFLVKRSKSKSAAASILEARSLVQATSSDRPATSGTTLSNTNSTSKDVTIADTSTDSTKAESSGTPFSVNCGNSQLKWSVLDKNASEWNLDGMWCNDGICSDNTTPVTPGTCTRLNPCSFKPSYDSVNTIPTSYRISLPDSSGIPSCWDIRALILRILQGLNGLTKTSATTAYLSPSLPDKFYGTSKQFSTSDMDLIKARASTQDIQLPVTFTVLYDSMKIPGMTSEGLAKALLNANMHFILYDTDTGDLAELSSTDLNGAREYKRYTGVYGWVDSVTYSRLKSQSGVTVL